MKRRAHNLSANTISGEAGQALILILVFLLLGSLLIPPALAHMGSALKTGRAYEEKTNILNTADAGIDSGLWRIKYNYWGGEIQSRNYDKYDFSTNFSYHTDNVNLMTANVTIHNVWIPTTQTPAQYGYSTAQVQNIIESTTNTTYPKVMVSGSANVSAGNQYNIKVYFSPAAGETNALMISSVGVWLPQGFEYDDNCNMDSYAPMNPYYQDPTITDHCGGKAVVWTFGCSANISYFPGFQTSNGLQYCEISFRYTTTGDEDKPAAISWITADNNVTNILPVTWDIDTRIFQIKSVTRNTTIEAYSSKCELRTMSKAMAGDYKAFGNTLIKDSNGDGRRDAWVNPATHDNTASVSNIPNSDNTGYADVVSAYLYWSAWLQTRFARSVWGLDSCTSSNLTTNWINTNPSTVWQYSSGYYRGHFTTGTHVESARYLELKNPVNLTSYTPGSLVVEWLQWTNTGTDQEDDDALKFQLSSDNGSSWGPLTTAFNGNINRGDSTHHYFYYTIPASYYTSTFKMRFYLNSFSGSSEYCYLDDIGIGQIEGTADTTATLKIVNPLGQTYSTTVTACKSSVIGNTSCTDYSYACKADITSLVKEHAEIKNDAYQVDHHTGNGTYTVGGVDATVNNNNWAYAGWSIIIIYECLDSVGRQIYLYDDFVYADDDTDVDFDKDGLWGGDITGFVVPQQIAGDTEAAKITCFVGEGDLGYTGDFIALNADNSTRSNPWAIPNPPTSYAKLWDGTTSTGNSAASPNNVWNSKSLGGSADGVDIDTFTITWASGLISPGDTTAHIDLPTGTDSWNLVYLILTVRSKTTVGGTGHYVIYNN